MKSWLHGVGIGLTSMGLISCAGSRTETEGNPVDNPFVSAGKVEQNEDQPFIISGTIIAPQAGVMEGRKGGTGNGIDALLTTIDSGLSQVDRAARKAGSDPLSKRPSEWRELEEIQEVKGHKAREFSRGAAGRMRFR